MEIIGMKKVVVVVVIVAIAVRVETVVEGLVVKTG